MIESSVHRPSARDWSDALLMSDTEALLGAIRNYIGTVKTPYDKRDLVAKLEAFLRRAETRESLLALLDPLDTKVLGSLLLLGPISEQALKDLFVGELPLFELGVRIANLLDRLLLFRFQLGGRRLLAINPLLEDELKDRILDLGLILGSTPTRGSALPDRSRASPDSARASPDGASPSPGTPLDAKAAIALFSFLFHTPFSIRKGGGLTKRAAERFAALYPDLAAGGGEVDRPGVLARALSAAGAIPVEGEEDRYPDREAFAHILADWGEELPYYLAAGLAVEAAEGRLSEGEKASNGRVDSARSLALVLAGALEALPAELALGKPALARWLRIAARRARYPADPALALDALEELGIIRVWDDRILLARPPRSGVSDGKAVGGKLAEGRGGVLVAEGAHALHLMPEAGLEDRLFVGCVAKPLSFGKVWSFDVERDTVRRAFAAGFPASLIRSHLEGLSGLGLPQSFAFSLAAWEEEYRSLRLYRGYALVVDERQRAVIERSKALGGLVAETLAPGVYFLSASTAEEAVAALAAAGLEAPPLVQPQGQGGQRLPLAQGRRGGARESEGEAGRSEVRGDIDALSELIALRRPSLAARAAPARAAPVRAAPEPAAPTSAASDSVAPAQAVFAQVALAQPDPEPRLAELRASLAASSRRDEDRRELAERIERRLVLTERQIAQSDPHPERLEAGGLDYLGKVRVVERALRSSGDRLEVLYRLPGAEPVRALLRPVKLDKNEKGLVLEAEDLGTGSPVRVSLGAVSTVRRLRASLFGEGQ